MKPTVDLQLQSKLNQKSFFFILFLAERRSVCRTLSCNVKVVTKTHSNPKKVNLFRENFFTTGRA